jgi:molybdate transport system substrate-binding protein
MYRFAALLILAIGAAAASSAEVPANLVCNTAIQGPVRELEASLHAKLHPPVTIVSGANAQGARRVDSGEPVDVAVLTKESIQQLAAKGLIKVQVDLAMSDVAIALADQAPTPVLRTPDDLVKLLRELPTLGYTTGASGQHMAQVIEQLGLTEVMKPKSTLVGGAAGKLLADGKVAAAVQQVGELRSEGAKNVVFLPEALQMHSIVTVAVMSNAPHPQAAMQMLRMLTSPSAVPVYQRWGLVPLYR